MRGVCCGGILNQQSKSEVRWDGKRGYRSGGGILLGGFCCCGLLNQQSTCEVRWDGKKFKKVFSREEGLFVGWVLLQCIAEFAEHEEVRKDGRGVIGREEGLFVGRVLLQWVAAVQE